MVARRVGRRGLVADATDTATDLIWDTMGATASALILTLWSLGGHSLKRRPGAALANKPFGSFLGVGLRNVARELIEEEKDDGWRDNARNPEGRSRAARTRGVAVVP